MISGDVKQTAAIRRTRQRRRGHIRWTTATHQAALLHKRALHAGVVLQHYTSAKYVSVLVH